MINKLISPFFKHNKCFIVAYDHGSNKNPDIFKYQSQNPKYIFELAKNIQATGIILNKGIAEIYSKLNYTIPLIIKLDAKPETTQKPNLICSVKYAKKLNAKAIGYTIYFGSSYEAEQIKIFSEIVEEAHLLNMGVILWAYTVDTNWKHISDINKLSFAIRQAYELGADLIKISLLENLSKLNFLKSLVPNLPIAIRGGEIIDNDKLFDQTKELIKQNADGLIIGRNLWQKENAIEIGKTLNSIIFKTNNNE